MPERLFVLRLLCFRMYVLSFTNAFGFRTWLILFLCYPISWVRCGTPFISTLVTLSFLFVVPILQVSGLIKSVFGLSSAVLSVLYTGLFGAENVGRFLLLLSVGVPLLGMVSSVPLNLVPAKHLSYAIERAQGVRNVWPTAFFRPKHCAVYVCSRSHILVIVLFPSKYLRSSPPIRFVI